VYVDPVLTANLYCSGHLDEVLHQVIGPFWRGIRQREPGVSTFVWTSRAGEGGEHLKVRLHGPDPLADPARVLLRHAANAFFARLGTPEEMRPPAWKEAGSPVVDSETDSNRSDRSLVWTAYRRSPICLGGGPFLDDEGYVSRITRCLAAACDRVLLLETDAAGRIPLQVRRSALLEGLIAGLAVSLDARSAYLEYHRDTLLRTRSEEGATADFLGFFDRRTEAMGPAVDALRRSVRSAWALDAAEVEPKRSDAAWCGALANLVWYIRPLGDDPDYRIDPLAEDSCFVPLFKAFHGLANQLGLNLIEEAFAHHLLLSVSAPAPDPLPAEQERGTIVTP
jgi:hypothetical protein